MKCTSEHCNRGVTSNTVESFNVNLKPNQHVVVNTLSANEFFQHFIRRSLYPSNNFVHLHFTSKKIFDTFS